jgi:hypothetical protein
MRVFRQFQAEVQLLRIHLPVTPVNRELGEFVCSSWAAIREPLRWVHIRALQAMFDKEVT